MCNFPLPQRVPKTTDVIMEMFFKEDTVHHRYKSYIANILKYSFCTIWDEIYPNPWVLFLPVFMDGVWMSCNVNVWGAILCCASSQQCPLQLGAQVPSTTTWYISLHQFTSATTDSLVFSSFQKITELMNFSHHIIDFFLCLIWYWVQSPAHFKKF